MVTTYRANRAQYTDISFQGVNANDIFDTPLPSMQGIAEDEGQYIYLTIPVILAHLCPVALEVLTALKVADEPVDVFSTPPQVDGELITLTLLPRSRWQTLLNIEVIQVRKTCYFHYKRL